jgi:hypothetical protein
VLPRSSTEVRAAGLPASQAIQGDSIRGDNIEASSAHGLAQIGLLAAEAITHHRAGLSVRPPGPDEVLIAALAVAVPLETPEAAVAAAALAVLTEVRSEEAMVGALGEAAGKLIQRHLIF